MEIEKKSKEKDLSKRKEYPGRIFISLALINQQHATKALFSSLGQEQWNLPPLLFPRINKSRPGEIKEI